MENQEKQTTLGHVGDPRMPDLEKGVIAGFRERENLGEILQGCFDAMDTDEQYLDQKVRVWNAMEEKQRGFSGPAETRYKHRARKGVFSVLYYPETDAVQLEYEAVAKD